MLSLMVQKSGVLDFVVDAKRRVRKGEAWQKRKKLRLGRKTKISRDVQWVGGWRRDATHGHDFIKVNDKNMVYAKNI